MSEEFALVKDLAIIMAVAGAAVIIFRRFRLPTVLGYILAGVAVGPFTFPHPPVENVAIIRLLADLGLVLLLFAVGLEFGWRNIRRVGLGVLLIGTVEMLIMISLGYQLGRLLGWTGLESIFLGSAMAISSSAILIKVLSDTGQLGSRVGRLIIGILVIEDFVAVVLLTLLSGVAATESTSAADIGWLVAKLAIFGAASLTIGTIVVPRLMGFVARLRSSEAMVITSLALCFCLALVGETLGVSAAAGAFLIGAVIGDTKDAEQVSGSLSPIRDMFGAIFFVSIGMLIEVRALPDNIVPALIIMAVFMVGKVVADTLGSFASGQSLPTSFRVGMGMSQSGEFSLAMIKSGVENGAIGTFVYQAFTAALAINTLVYPFVFRSADRAAALVDRYAPPTAKRYALDKAAAFQRFRTRLQVDPDFAAEIRRSARALLVNLSVIVIIIGVGTLGVEFAPQIASALGVPAAVAGSVVGVAVLALCFPPLVAGWRALQEISYRVTSRLARIPTTDLTAPRPLRRLIAESVTVVVLLFIGLWSIPLLGRLLALGSLAAPVPLLVIAAIVALGFRSLRRIHAELVRAFSGTFLQPEGGETEAVPGPAADAGPGVSRAEAEMRALAAASADRAPYASRMATEGMVWDVVDSTQERGYHIVTLEFRAEGVVGGDAGQEEFYIDLSGDVRLRQVVNWPRTRPRRIPMPALYGVALAVLGGLTALSLVLVSRGP